jgi:type IX secretion system PorP/SprF family membrane protein
MKIKLLSILFFVVTVSAFAQQDPLYNLYMFNQAMINPAYNGIYNATNATFISRAQWTGINGAPVTNTLNANTSFMNERLGAGLLVVNDRLGVNNNFEAQAAISYKLKLGEDRLSFGLQGGVINYTYDYTDLNLEVVDVNLTQQHMPNFSKPTMGFGMFYKSANYFAGLSIPRLMNVNIEDGVMNSTRYKRHVYLSGGFLISKYENIKIKPSVLLRVVEGGPTALDTNVSVLFLETLWAGVSIRNFQALSLNAQLEIKNSFRIGYGFELPTNSLYGTAKGTHELMLSIDFEVGRSQYALRRYF